MLKYKINRPVTSVTVFGCGGTGSRTVPLLAQLLTSHEFTKNVRLVLVDGDVVEEKNCKRQLFIKQEIDKNKAEVIARRYRLGFEARTEAVPYFVPSVENQMAYLKGLQKNTEMISVDESTRHFFKTFLECFAPAGMDAAFFSSLDNFEVMIRQGSVRQGISPVLFTNTALFVMCVDSVDARKRILTLIQTLGYILGIESREALSNMIVIDSGNEDIFGQVSYFNPVVSTLCPFPELLKEIPDRVPYSVQLRYVPFPIGKYMHMVEGESTKSCADMDQTMAINNMMAAMIAMIFQNLLYGLEMDYHTINCNLNGSFYTEKLTLSWLKGMLSTDPNYLKAVVDQMLVGELPEEERDLLTGAGMSRTSTFRKVPMYFGMDRGRVDDGITMNAVQPKARVDRIAGAFPVGARAFITTGDMEDNLRGFSEAPLCSSVAGESLHLWKYSDFAYGNWANLVWPVLMQGLKTGFIKLTESVSTHAVACLSMCSGPVVMSKRMDQDQLAVFCQENYVSSGWEYGRKFEEISSNTWVMSRADLVGFGKQDLSSVSYKDTLKKQLGVEMPFIEGKLVMLPNDGKTLIAGCNLLLNTYHDPGQRAPKYVAPSFLVICQAIVDSLTPEKVYEIHKELVAKLAPGKALDVMLLRTPESLVLGREGLLVGLSLRIGERGGITMVRKDRSNILSSHTKGLAIICDYHGGMFGDEMKESEYYISTHGAFVEKKFIEEMTFASIESRAKLLLRA